MVQKFLEDDNLDQLCTRDPLVRKAWSIPGRLKCRQKHIDFTLV